MAFSLSFSNDTTPNFEIAPAISRRPLRYCETGPDSREDDQDPNCADWEQRFDLTVYEEQVHQPNKTTIILNKLPKGGEVVGSAELNQCEVAVHYRFLDPERVRCLRDPYQTSFIDPASTSTAALATAAQQMPPPEFLLKGDTTVKFPTHDPFGAFEAKKLNERIIQAVARAAGLREDFKVGSREDRWACAVYGECAFLSLRINKANRKRVRAALISGSWWVRIYLVEMHPKANGMWITRTPNPAPPMGPEDQLRLESALRTIREQRQN